MKKSSLTSTSTCCQLSEFSYQKVEVGTRRSENGPCQPAAKQLICNLLIPSRPDLTSISTLSSTCCQLSEFSYQKVEVGNRRSENGPYQPAAKQLICNLLIPSRPDLISTLSSTSTCCQLSEFGYQKVEVGTRRSENGPCQLTTNPLTFKQLTTNQLTFKQLTPKRLNFEHLNRVVGVLLLLLTSVTAFAQHTNNPFFNQDSLKLISSQFKFTEGASVDRHGNVFFTDQPNNKIWEYTVDGNLEVFLSPAGRANGTMFDNKGNLIVCADEHNQLWSVDKNKKIKVLLSGYEGKNLNGPNDIWIDAKGGIFFTDPYYQRDYWSRTSPELPNQSVYYIKKASGKAKLVADNLKQPNGIVGTPDGKFLYVSDIGAGKTYRYAIGANATLTDRRLIINQGSDGMVLDAQGNIYLSGKGVTIYNKEGTKIGHIDVPENWVGNLCFGGKNRDVLFITASKSLYKIKMNAKGVE